MPPLPPLPIHHARSAGQELRTRPVPIKDKSQRPTKKPGPPRPPQPPPTPRPFITGTASSLELHRWHVFKEKKNKKASCCPQTVHHVNAKRSLHPVIMMQFYFIFFYTPCHHHPVSSIHQNTGRFAFCGEVSLGERRTVPVGIVRTFFQTRAF